MINTRFARVFRFACAATGCFLIPALLILAQDAGVVPSPTPPESSTEAQSSPAPESTETQSSTPAQSSAAPQSSTDTQSSTKIQSSSTVKTPPLNEDAGIGRFSRFPVSLSVWLQGGYDDNVLTSTNAHGSLFTSGNMALGYQFGSPRTRLTLSAGGGLSYYFDRPGNSKLDENAFLDLSLSQKATPRLTLGALLHVAYQIEPDFNYNIGPDRRSGNYFYSQDRFTAAYLWTQRFSTLTSYSPGIVRYDKSTIAAFEDRFENTLGNEFRFRAWPATILVAEYRYEVITYDSVSRDSTTHFALAGFDHNFNPRLLLTVRGGEEFRSSNFGGNNTDPYFESGLTYAFGHNSLSFTNRYSIEEPNLSTIAIRNTFRTGLSGKYDITPRISSTFGFYYQHSDNQAFNSGGIASPAFLEQSVDFAFTLRYSITRVWGIQAGYNHTQVISDLAGRDYSRNRYFAGLGLHF
jgi:hypothetical protein